MFLVSLFSAGNLRAGEATELTVHTGDIFVMQFPSGSERPLWAELNGRRFPAVASEDGESVYVLLGVDLEAEAGTYPVRIVFVDEERAENSHTVRVRKKDFPVEKLTLPEKMVTPPVELLARIARERKAAAAVYSGSEPTPMWTPPFTRPVEGDPSGNFGRRRILNGKPRSPHSGEDYSAERGREVKAVARGRVRMADELYYSGKTVLIDHGGGLVSQYFHLDRIQVTEGQQVEKGHPLGNVGATGRVTAPHLHFGIRLFGMRTDPSLLWEIFPP